MTTGSKQDFQMDEDVPLILPANYLKNEDGIFKIEDIIKKGEVVGEKTITLSRTPFDLSLIHI